MVKFKYQNCITPRRARLQLASVTHFFTVHLPCTNKLNALQRKVLPEGTDVNKLPC